MPEPRDAGSQAAAGEPVVNFERYGTLRAERGLATRRRVTHAHALMRFRSFRPVRLFYPRNITEICRPAILSISRVLPPPEEGYYQANHLTQSTRGPSRPPRQSHVPPTSLGCNFFSRHFQQRRHAQSRHVNTIKLDSISVAAALTTH